MRYIWLSSLLAMACHAQAQAPTTPALPSGPLESGPSMKYDPQIVTALLDLLNVKDKTRPSNTDFTDTSLKDILVLGTPAGFHLRNRYTHLGVSLAEGLAFTTDPRLKDQLIELARWERSHEIRAVSLIAVATRREPAHISIFREALINIDPEVRFGALEALEIWDQSGIKEELAKVIETDRSPVVRIYAAQALARRGDPKGLEELRKEVATSGDWLARAMAIRYLGDLGEGEDYDRMLGRIGLEQNNDFVLAEAAIAALKLFPKKSPELAAPTPAPMPPPPPPSGGAAAPNLFVELEPLVITAPRLKIPATLQIDGRVNSTLLTLLENKANARPKPEDLNDPSIMTLNSLSSPAGFQLKIRYTELGFLLTEGLAGTADLILRNKIINVAHQGTNPQVRAAAMVAVAYDKDPMDRGLFQEGLLSQDITVRFGAMEGLLVWNQPDAMSDVGSIARTDLSPPVRAWAAGALLRNRDQGGRDILVRFTDDQDWLARAMSYRYLGELGVPDDFERILLNLSRESNNFVRSEMCGALLRLYARGARKQ